MALGNLFGRSENRLRPVWQASVPDHAISLTWSPDGARHGGRSGQRTHHRL